MTREFGGGMDPTMFSPGECARCGAKTTPGQGCESCESGDAVGACEFCGGPLRRSGSCPWDYQHSRNDPRWESSTARRAEYEVGTRLRVSGDDGIETVSYRRENRGAFVVSNRRGREWSIDPSQIVGLAR